MHHAPQPLPMLFLPLKSQCWSAPPLCHLPKSIRAQVIQSGRLRFRHALRLKRAQGNQLYCEHRQLLMVIRLLQPIRPQLWCLFNRAHHQSGLAQESLNLIRASTMETSAMSRHSKVQRLREWSPVARNRHLPWCYRCSLSQCLPKSLETARHVITDTLIERKEGAECNGSVSGYVRSSRVAFIPMLRCSRVLFYLKNSRSEGVMVRKEICVIGNILFVLVTFIKHLVCSRGLRFPSILRSRSSMPYSCLSPATPDIRALNFIYLNTSFTYDKDTGRYKNVPARDRW